MDLHVTCTCRHFQQSYHGRVSFGFDLPFVHLLTCLLLHIACDMHMPGQSPHTCKPAQTPSWRCCEPVCWRTSARRALSFNHSANLHAAATMSIAPCHCASTPPHCLHHIWNLSSPYMHWCFDTGVPQTACQWWYNTNAILYTLPSEVTSCPWGVGLCSKAHTPANAISQRPIHLPAVGLKAHQLKCLLHVHQCGVFHVHRCCIPDLQPCTLLTLSHSSDYNI